MKRITLGIGFLWVHMNLLFAQSPVQDTRGYLPNRSPLIEKAYWELPLGAIKPRGWLKEQLVRQKNGMSGHLDELYPQVMSNRNGWLGGDGDQWERGPYWIDGLLPLAYLLDDDSLKAKVKPWIEWTLQSQREDGYFGPVTPEGGYEPEPGIQRDNAEDWWPKMVMLKVLQQHYNATGDERVIALFTNYFRYQLQTLPGKPLGHWTFWGNRRGGDNLMVVYWLYNITGDPFLLELSELIHRQTYDWTNVFLERNQLATPGNLHCVNIAQGFKEPVIYYQQSRDKKHLQAVRTGFQDLMKFNGLPHGLYGGDEALHGNNPTQGSEFCSAVEMMFSLESMLSITGELDFAERLERIAFNPLPTQATDDYSGRQYFQQANQVMVSRHLRNFVNSNGGTTTCFGVLTGYPCCTANMHQGWPKYTQNLWYATPDQGLAALVYAPSEVTATVGDGHEVTFTEKTHYPFEESIRFTMSQGPDESVTFPLTLRVPTWCLRATVMVNGKLYEESGGGKTVTINRSWQQGDQVTLQLPMQLRSATWYEKSVSVEHGPLVYALKMDEHWRFVENTQDPEKYGDYYEVTSDSPWNYGLLKAEATDSLPSALEVVRNEGPVADYPWNVDNAPITIRAKAKRIPQWQLYNEMSGPLIFSPDSEVSTEAEDITLIPYGCSTLRVSAFPVVW